MTSIMICSIENCEKPSSKRGYCNAHYIRFRRHGNPELGRRTPGSNHCGKGECPAAKKIRAHIHYIENSEEYKERYKVWIENNTKSYLERKKNYFSREEVKVASRERTRRWKAENPERKRQMDLEFKEKNRALVTSYKGKYRAARKMATPPWLTSEHINEIRQVYKEARRLSLETGIPHEVDHIVPLAGKIVSGLHVPWNLRAIPKTENNRRPRIYAQD